MKRVALSRLAALLAVLFVLSPASVLACSVPVFRYALERWPSDSFRAVVLRRGPLAAEGEAGVRLLGGADQPDDRAAPNVRVETLDLAATNAILAAEFQPEAEKGLPRVLLLYPPLPGEEDGPACALGLCPAAPETAAGRGHFAASVPLEAGAVRALLDSPARQELGRRLLRGDSIVWVLVEGGNRERDDAAATLLGAELKKQEQAAAAAPPAEADPAGAAVTAADALPVVFSVLRLSRTDAAEAGFLSVLLNTEADLGKYADQPIVFPVFGRGRVLYALVGRGITADHIAEACDYLTGPCSCEVKEQNPGTDLLMAVDWEQIADGRMLTDDPAPPLTGVMPDTTTAVRISQGAPAAKSAGEPRVGFPPESRRVLRNAALTLGAMALGLVLLGGLLVHRQNKGGKQP